MRAPAAASSAGRLDACEPSRRLRVTTRETQEYLARHLAGREIEDDVARWAELVPPYRQRLADVS